MEDEEFKKLRHRFWRLGKERRFEVIKKMGFQTIEPFSGIDPASKTEANPNGKPYDPSAERVQREMLFYIWSRTHSMVGNGLMDQLIALIEEQEAQITAEEESASYLKEPRPTEFPPTKEELAAMKYVPGTKKEI
jgi:hypothetical protein